MDKTQLVKMITIFLKLHILLFVSPLLLLKLPQYSCIYQINARYFPIGYALPTVLMFIFVLVLSAMDFWVVKNISGRLLVGLRWRSEYDQKEKEVWKFESYDQKFTANRVDKAFFWGSQLLGTVIWGFFFIINILGLHFFNVIIINKNSVLFYLSAHQCVSLIFMDTINVEEITIRNLMI